MAPLYFKDSSINYVYEYNLLGIALSGNKTNDTVMEMAVMKCNIKSNEVISDFKLLKFFIKSKLFTTFCIDAYGCQLVEFQFERGALFYVAWRKAVLKLWRIPYTTQCHLFYTTLFLLKYNWRKDVLNLFAHV